MFLLLGFAFLAGIATVLSPCIIPVLPILLSGGVDKGSYRPLGIILGLILSFIFFTLLLTTLVHLFGISANGLRFFAILVIALFGLMMLFPQLGEFFAKKTAKIAEIGSNLQSTNTGGDGLWSGLILGSALGLVWTPCAGPILAAVSTLAATRDLSWEAVWITISYSLGAAIPMYFIAYGGQKILSSSKFLARHAEGVRKAFGVLMLIAALSIATNFDMVFQQWSYQFIPTFVPDDHPAVRRELAKVRGDDIEIETPMNGLRQLPILRDAPEFVGITNWLNSSPLTIEQLKGKVVLIDFWTYSCINCLRTLPYLRDLYSKYKDKDFVLIGVHTPEFEFEKDLKNVEDAVKRLNIPYPVVQDNDFQTWKAYRNSYWPAHYLIDQQGKVRYVHFGEGAYVETENAVRHLLMELPLSKPEEPSAHRPISAETYLGYGRAQHYVHKILPNQVSDYTFDFPLPPDNVGLRGKWFVDKDFIRAESEDAALSIKFLATRVYLVLSGKSDQPVTVFLEQNPIPKLYYTNDMDEKGRIFVKEDRKYDIINLHKDYGVHTITLRIPKGISAYAFTFGDEE